MKMPSEAEQARLEAEELERRQAKEDPHPYLTQLRDCFTVELCGDDQAYWRIRCVEKNCDRSKSGWQLRRKFLSGFKADISKGDYNALMAHANAPHREK